MSICCDVRSRFVRDRGVRKRRSDGAPGLGHPVWLGFPGVDEDAIVGRRLDLGNEFRLCDSPPDPTSRQVRPE